MTQSGRIVLLVILAAVAAWALARPLWGTVSPAPARGTLTAAERDAGFSYAPDVAAYDRQAFEAAIAAARPEARRLIEAVDGLVRVRFGPVDQGGSLGVTSSGADGIDVTIDLATVQRRFGARGIARVVLHELGHVVDFTILPADVRRTLDAGIPRGYACEPGEPTGSCATIAERFAESFAKWAMNDIGVDLYIGYKVPPPAVPLEDWGQPLATLPL